MLQIMASYCSYILVYFHNSLIHQVKLIDLQFRDTMVSILEVHIWERLEVGQTNKQACDAIKISKRHG